MATATHVSQTPVLDDLEAAIDLAIERVGHKLVVAAPLGLGKPVQLLNALYRRACNDTSLSLHLYTALSLEVPAPSSEIEASLAGPIMERLFGDYEGLAYLADLRAGRLPPNVQISEFYVKAGSMKGVASSQRNYISSNYTHVARDICAAGVNVLCQLVAFRETGDKLELSLSCNPDTALDVLDLLEENHAGNYVTLGQLHPDLPFMGHDAQVAPERFTALLRNQSWNRRLFAVPNAAVPLTDYATALHASTLVVDGGTLQIGIGALGDAVAQALILRHGHNARYRTLLAELGVATANAHADGLSKGLYVSTEMFVNGMLRLMQAGIVRRRVYDDLRIQQGLNSGAVTETIDEQFYRYAKETGLLPRTLTPDSLATLQRYGLAGKGVFLRGDDLFVDGEHFANDTDDPRTVTALKNTGEHILQNGCVLHGGFFLGPADFYESLRNMTPEQLDEICMTSVGRTNQLLRNPELYCAQRTDARFINTGMMVSLSGAVASDALEDGTVISGVGGQYNFVAMAHDLPGARSVLCIRATRGAGRDVASNIVPHYGHTTIPRHLRDVVVTEYGVADLRGQSDADVIKRLLAVADSRFQDDLLAWAKTVGKVEQDYVIPGEQRNNTPQHIAGALGGARDLLPDYPFGTELTKQEIDLAASLRRIKALSDEPGHFLARAFRALIHHADSGAAKPYLERIHLEHPNTSREFLIQQLLLLDLEERGLLRVS